MKNLKLLLSILLVAFGLQASAQSNSLRVSKDGAYIEYSSGEPFLWLGDTAWELLHVLNREEATLYLDNRAEKGFTVIQTVALAEIEGVTRPNAYGHLPLIDQDPSRPNSAYFDHVDYIIDEAAKRGLYVALLPTWGCHVVDLWSNDKPIFTPESAYAYGKFIAARYANKPIIWVLGGDRNIISEEAHQIWNQMARGIEESAGTEALITYHPQGNTSSSAWLHNTEWLDFNSAQSGHTERYDKVYRFCYENQKLSPRKPFVNIEPAYEDIGIKFWLYTSPSDRAQYIQDDGLVINHDMYKEGYFNDYDVRVAAYWTLLTGAAGHTYGNNAVWQMFKPNTFSPVPSIHYWHQALDRPGAESMRYVSEIFTRFPLRSFAQDQSIVYGPNYEGGSYIIAAAARDKSFALLYVAQGREISIKCDHLSLSGKYQWFNPSNGEMEPLTEFDSSEILTTQPPSSSDWLLILE